MKKAGSTCSTRAQQPAESWIHNKRLLCDICNLIVQYLPTLQLIKLNAFKLIVQNCIDCDLPGTSLKQHPSKILIFVIDAFVSPYYNPKVACHLKWSSMDPNGKYIIFKLQTLRFRTVFSAMDQARSLWFCIICRIKGWNTMNIVPFTSLVCGYKKKHHLFLICYCHHVVLFQSYLVRFWVNLKQPSSGNKHHCLPLCTVDSQSYTIMIKPSLMDH